MLARPVAFEQDKLAIFLRNQEMHLHFSKLHAIKNRKNSYLPNLESLNPNKKFRRLTLLNFLIKEKQYFINRDNNIIFKKLKGIFQRPNTIRNDQEILRRYLNIQRCSRIKLSEYKKNLLDKENSFIKTRLNKTRSVIDMKQLDYEFMRAKKISGYLRKIHSKDNVNKIYLNQKESDIIREYEQNKMYSYIKEKIKKFKQNQTTREYNSSFNSLLPSFTSRSARTLKTESPGKKRKGSFKIDKRILSKIRYV
jgi:hypothetical protein